MDNIKRVINFNVNKQILKNLKFLPIFILVTLISFRDSSFPQRVIDGGLFISNQLKYEPNSLMYESFTNSFTILHYFAATLLYLNLNLFLISFIFQFINLIIFSLSLYFINNYFKMNLLINYFSIFICLNSIPIWISNLTLNYPLFISSVNTYGQFGLSLSLLSISFVLNKNTKNFFIFIPFFLSIHLGWGLTTVFVLLIFLILKRFKFEIKNLPIKRLLYSLVFVLPFWIHFYGSKNKIKTNINQDEINKLYKTYIENWDYHRSFTFDSNKYQIHLTILVLIFILIIIMYILKNFQIDILIITFLNSILALILYYVDFKIFNKNNILLNSFMPGKIINLSLLLYLIIIIILIDSILKASYNYIFKRVLNRNLFNFFSFFIILIFYNFNLNFFNVGNLNLFKFDIYNFKSESTICDELKNNFSQVVTIGNASQIIPLNCRNKILVDTTQIDFMPYSSQSLPKLKQIMEEIYGFDFSSRSNTSRLIGIASIPSGGIDELLVRTIWSTRTTETWNYLSCKYNFNYLVVPNTFIIKLDPFKQGEFFTLYKINSDCSNEISNFIGDIYFSLPIEFDNNRNYFYWLTDKESILSLKNINQNVEPVSLQLKFEPNPCKNQYAIDIFFDKYKYSLNVGDKSVLLNLSLISSPQNLYSIVFKLRSDIKSCNIDGELRNLIAKVNEIKVS